MIEQSLDPQPLVEQVEPGDIDRFPPGVGVPDELGAVLHLDLVGRDDPVMVGIREGVRPLPPAVDGIAGGLASGRPDDRRQTAHVRDEIGVIGGVDGQIEAKVRFVDDAQIGQRLDATIHHRTQVLEPVDRPAGGRRQLPGDERIRRPLVVVREVQIGPAVEQGRLPADLVFPRPLRLQRGVPDGAVDQRRNVGAVDARGLRQEEAGRIGRSRLVARRTDGTAQSQAVEPAPLREERLFRDYVRHAQFRIIDCLEVLTEGAVVIRAQPAIDEQPVFVPELLLHKCAHGRGYRGALAHRGDGSARHGRGAPRQVLPERHAQVVLGLEVLPAEGGARRELRAQAK